MRSDSACTRLRCLHFYSDCADCPECCSSIVCGSCCSVHGPLEEPADLSPRCARRLPGDCRSRAVADVSEKVRRSSKPDEKLENLGGDTHERSKPDEKLENLGGDTHERSFPDDDAETNSATKESNTDNTAEYETFIATRNYDLSAIPVAHDTASPRALTASSDKDVTDEDCWTFVEKATCGVLALLIFVVFVAIYLQLSRHYFTAV